DTEQELWIHQHSAERHFDARVEISLHTPLSIELQQLFKMDIAYRLPIRPAQQSGQDLLGTLFVRRFGWRAGKNAAAARRLSMALCVIGAGNRNLIDRRRNAGMSMQIVMCLVRLALGFEQ